MGLGKKEEIEMIKNCYRRRKKRGRELWKLIEKEWKWPKKKKSKYRGVSWLAREKKWYVQYYRKGVSYSVGRYKNEKAAAEAYDDAVRAAGLTKKLNFPARRPKWERRPNWPSSKKPASSKGPAKKKKPSSKGRR
jgi:hypothetical protein